MKIKEKRCERFFWSFLYKTYFWLMLLNFEILVFFWRQFYQEKRKRMSKEKFKTASKVQSDFSQKVTTMPLKSSKTKTTLIRSGNLFDWSSSQADQVRKLELIFINYKSKVAGRSGQEFGTDLHLLQVRGRRPSIRSGNWDWSSPTTSPRSQADRVWKFGQD